jgi:hypothetical protein
MRGALIAGLFGAVAALVLSTAVPDPRPEDARPFPTALTVAGSGIGAPAAFAANSAEEGAYYQHLAHRYSTPRPPGTAPAVDDAALTGIVQRLCVTCHNDQLRTGNMSLEGFDVARTEESAELAEKMIVKLRLNMMPPPGIPRPGGDSLVALVETLERKLDEAVAAAPNPGFRLPQRLNQAEYERTIRDLLEVQVDASAYLPPETISDSFDNIADVQSISPALLEGYMRAAAHVARVAVGDPGASPRQITYQVPQTTNQREQVEGAPWGSRGGISIVHHFPADGQYVFRLELHSETEGSLFGRHSPGEQMELSIDGERVALKEIDRWMTEEDPEGLTIITDPIPVRAGARRVAAVFVPTADAPINDLMAPIEHTMADLWIARDLGITTVPHLRDLRIDGPYDPTGVSETASRSRVFSCRPDSPEGERPCAREIIERLGSEAFRRPLTENDREGLLQLYEEGTEDGGFEGGVRLALQAILSSPHFVFRVDREPEGAWDGGDRFPIADISLASRLSYFLWGRHPDETLMELAEENRLNDPAVLEAQVRRMLQDPRADALGERFAAQWLRLPRLQALHPDPQRHPEFDDRLRAAMRQETVLFFNHLVREDRSLRELFTADYTFVNGRLARHYGISDAVGSDFRRVEVTDPRRRGLGILGHASVLALTSHANRTSPVDRGLWVMEVLMGTEPPPPPPVPSLDETAAADEADGRALTVRERLAIHRNNPTCNSCHQFIDPLGLPLEHFDVTGLWRIRDSGNPLDPTGQLWDGTVLETPQDLRDAVLSLETQVMRNFTENLMRYALGRRVHHYDQPAIRRIANDAAANDHRMSSYILGVVMSEPFRFRTVQQAVDDDGTDRD